MEGATDTIAFDEIARYLAAGHLCPSLSEAHGMLCGLICGGEQRALETWLVQVVPAPEGDPAFVESARNRLHAWAETVAAELEAPDRILELPSPGDGAPLGERAQWLYDWTRGFLYGLGLCGRGPAEPSAQVREILADLSALTRMDLDGLDECEENEQALAELIEFVRVAAMLIHQEYACGGHPKAAERPSAGEGPE